MVADGVFTNSEDVAGIIVMNDGKNSIDRNFFYLSGVDGGAFEKSALLKTREGIEIFTRKVEEEIARETGHEVTVVDSQQNLTNALLSRFNKGDTIGLNFDSLTVNMYSMFKKNSQDFKFDDVSRSLYEARQTKSPEEVRKLKRAAQIGSDAYPEAIEKVREGMSETELAGIIVAKVMELGAEAPSFMPGVSFGSNSAIPHHFPGERKLRKGDFILIDFGAQVKRYCSDITRTAVFGKATPKQKRIYDLVRKSQMLAMDSIRSGVVGSMPHNKALEFIDGTEFKGCFIHGLGHGIGMEVHDHQAMDSTSTVSLRAGMAVTVEPGIYEPNYGGVRIEDDIIITTNGFEMMSRNTPDELLEVY